MVKKLVSVLCICAYFGLAHAQIPQEIWQVHWHPLLFVLLYYIFNKKTLIIYNIFIKLYLTNK